jgi:hypothetical protein
LNPLKPREAMAIELLNQKSAEGVPLRQIITDAILNHYTNNHEIDENNLNSLVSKLDAIYNLIVEKVSITNHPNVSTNSNDTDIKLSSDFLFSIRKGSKPGSKMIDGEIVLRPKY